MNARRALESLADSAPARRALYAARVAAAPREWLARRRAAVARLARRAPELAVDRERGYARFEPGYLQGFDALCAALRAEDARRAPELAALLGGLGTKERLTVDLFSDELLAREPRYVDAALADELLLPIAAYLRTVPHLGRVALALSLPIEAGEPAYHQRFHVDNDDFRQV
jgi:hypothetical protein